MGSVGDRSMGPGPCSKYCGSSVNRLACHARLSEDAEPRSDKGETGGEHEIGGPRGSGRNLSHGPSPSLVSPSWLGRGLSGTREGRTQGRRRRLADGDDAVSCLCRFGGLVSTISLGSSVSIFGLAFLTTSTRMGETEQLSVLTQGKAEPDAAELGVPSSSRAGGGKGAAGARRGAEENGPFNDMPGSDCMQREGQGISRASALERPPPTSTTARDALQEWWAFLPLLPPPCWPCCCLPWNSTLRWLPPQRSQTCFRPWMHGPSVAQEPVEEI